jgi:hypothetical protein
VLGYYAKLRLLRRGRLRAGAIGEETLHQAALDLAGGGDEVVLGGNGLLDGAEDVGDAALFGERRKGDRDPLRGSISQSTGIGPISVSLKPSGTVGSAVRRLTGIARP